MIKILDALFYGFIFKMLPKWGAWILMGDILMGMLSQDVLNIIHINALISAIPFTIVGMWAFVYERIRGKK